MQKKLFRYFGAKTYMLDDIIRLISPLYSNKKIVCFVDVFGGAGNVLLNIPLEWRINRVYNDIDLRLYNLLNDLKDDKKRELLFEKLFWVLSSRKLLNDFKEKENNNSFEFLYRIFYSFNASMTNYGIEINTIRNPGSVQLNNLKKNWHYIKEWHIEYLDFKDLIKKYDSKNTFFYLDPPYLKGGKNYKHSFTEADFKELKNSLDDIQGYYMMNESEADFDKIIKIFGEPKLIKKYANHVNNNRKQTESKNKNKYRQEGYWMNY